ncbi:hypothetical protein TRFO_26486 [Tritrichomonas foetus]|uniref:Uncharacterized protein n=1 Tax=Tritrichomonas foetus TaxID=1144522 RepID=A0A1J4K7Q0_9EUKA|nr:hypothetical protein TRFO_26486 [Tritrichomonas foetus]|eukprot:OHT05740.1 hypothetical protein TRFO_26486 [Tritrichomonas foetus]
MDLAPITTFPNSATKCALISSDEILQINSNTVSITSIRTGFCKYSYFLPQVPRLFTINPLNPTRFAVVYPATDSIPETVVLIKTITGKAIKKFASKSLNHHFKHIALGSHLFFVIDTDPDVVYFTQPTGSSINQFQFNDNITFLCANRTTTQFMAMVNNKHAIVVDAQGPKQTNDIPFNKFTFIELNDSSLNFGSPDGQVFFININDGKNRSISTPHSTQCLSCTNNYGVTTDGIVFSTDNGQAVATVSNPISVLSFESTVAVICKDQISIFESAKRPICSVSQLQPPEPFISDQFSIEPSIYFAASTAIYSFALSLNEISKFTSIQEKIKKIVSCHACVSCIYNNASDGDKIMTFATGIKKRDEPGIDVLCDLNNKTWILQKDSILTYRRKLLDIEEIGKIPMPENHTYNRIFRIKNTVGIYSPADGLAAYVRDGKLVSFRLPRNVNIIQWPALCTKEYVYICRKKTENLEELDVEDFTCIKASISSCCWLANTLFAVENRDVLALSARGTKRVIDQLQNTMCAITVALPSELVFVTTLPDLRVFTLKTPFLYVAMLDIEPNDIKTLRYILSYIPRLSIDPRQVATLPPMNAMSILNRAPPKFITPETIIVYARFAKFDELYRIAKESNQKNDILRLIAEAASAVGQFQIAQDIYEEIGDDEALFRLFMVNQNASNLRILATKSKFAPAIEYFGIKPLPQEDESKLSYEKLKNLQLPRLKEPYTGEEFTLYAGEGSESVPIFPPSFDEPTDFGVREFPLTGEEAEMEIQQQQELDNLAAVAATGEGENGEDEKDKEEIEYKERPTELDTNKEDELELDQFFDDNDEEEKAKPTFNFTINTGGGGPRRNATRVGFQLDNYNGNQSNNNTDNSENSENIVNRRRGMTTRAKKFNFDIPGVTTTGGGSNEAPVMAPKQDSTPPDFAAMYRSEEISINFVSEGPPNPPISSNQGNSESDNDNNTPNVADQFTSNLFMDMTFT